METLSKLLDKISTYDFLNYLLPGSIFCVLLKHLVGYDIIAFSMIENFLICYFVGLVISRFGSLVIKEVMKKVDFFVEVNYKDFLAAEKVDPKLTVLNAVNNMFCSFASAMSLLLLAYLVKYIAIIATIVTNHFGLIVIVLLLVLFLFSVRKQTKFIKRRVENTQNQDISQ
jgi:hypothetical protein